MDDILVRNMRCCGNVYEGMRCKKQHHYEFYQKQGFVVAGMVPDVNRPGNPGMLMAKSVMR
jgi:hypothetical protein